MAGHALVVGDGLDVREGAVLEVVGVDEDSAGARAVGRALLVVGGGLIFFHEGGNGCDHERRFGQAAEELGELGLHLVDVPR